MHSAEGKKEGKHIVKLFTRHYTSVFNPKTAIEKFFQNGKPGLGRFASCVATSTRNAVFGFKPNTVHLAPRRERGRPARFCSGLRARCPRSFMLTALGLSRVFRRWATRRRGQPLGGAAAAQSLRMNPFSCCHFPLGGGRGDKVVRNETRQPGCNPTALRGGNRLAGSVDCQGQPAG